MTGFGTAAREAPGGAFTCEVRSVNHRTLKVSLKVPALLASREPDLEGLVRGTVARGAVQASVHLRRTTPAATALFDHALARAYAEELAELARETGLPGEPDLALVAGLPGVVTAGTPDGEEEEALAGAAVEAFAAALASLDASREREGRALRADLERRMGRIARALARVGKRAPKMVLAARRRLEKRLQEVLGALPDPSAREAVSREVVLLAERSDVSEEITRLEAHLAAFREALDARGEVGRRLDFLLQEMLREVNTIGSKSQDAVIGAAVVDMKVEVDRMKEQAANIE